MFAPDIRDERLMELRRRGLSVEPRVPWRSFGSFVALSFFVLVSLAVAATYWLVDLADMSAKGVVTALLAIALAELLIQRQHFFGTGIESALWLGGLFAFIVGLPSEGRPEGILLFAAASAVAGARLRNALFGALSMVFVIAYAVVRDMHLIAAAIGVAVSLLALAALAKEWKRPSTERLWIALLVIPPLASAFATLTRVDVWWVIVYFALAALCAAAGLHLRAHAALIAAAVYTILFVSKAQADDLLPFAPEWRFILGGAILLAASALIARLLRDRTRGLTVTPEDLTAYDKEIEILATIAAQPQVEAPPEKGGGGGFGGAGATGDF